MKIGFPNQDRIAELEEIISEQEQIIENYKLAEKEWKEEKMQLYIRIEQLKRSIRVNNARGAGRKKRATKEQIEKIMKLKKGGLSLKEIADILESETGEHWCKSTINNALKFGLGKEFITVNL